MQYHFHNVSIRDLLVKTNGPIKELEKNDNGIYFFFFFFGLSEFVMQESRKFWYKFITSVNPCL